MDQHNYKYFITKKREYNSTYVDMGKYNIRVIVAGIPPVPKTNIRLREQEKGKAKQRKKLTYNKLLGF